MARQCVEIELDTDTGRFSVGMEPRDEEAGEPAGQGPGEEAGEPAAGAAPGAAGATDENYKPYLQPAKSLEDALSTARDLLSGATGAQAQAAEADMATGFASAGGAMGAGRQAG